MSVNYIVCRPRNVIFRGFLERDTISGSVRYGGDCAEQLSRLSRMTLVHGATFMNLGTFINCAELRRIIYRLDLKILNQRISVAKTSLGRSVRIIHYCLI